MRPVTELIVHTSATPASRDIGVKEIDLMHRQRGFRSIGYHWVIRRNGIVEQGRREAVAGAHVTGRNANSIGICLVGGVDSQGRGEANYTPAQMTSLSHLLLQLLTRYPGARIIGHRDTGAKKDCPSFDVAHWIETRELTRPRNLA